MEAAVISDPVLRKLRRSVFSEMGFIYQVLATFRNV